MTHAEEDRLVSGMGRPLRVLAITNMFPSESNKVFGIFVARQLRALSALDTDVRLVANRTARGGWRNPFKYAWLAFRAGIAALFGGYDVIVGHYLYPTAAITRTASKLARVPFVVVAHGTDVTSLATREDSAARSARESLNEADMVVAVSNSLATRIRKELGLSPKVDIEVVHMGVDTELFHPDDTARHRLGWAQSERVVLFVGNLVPVKGPDIALEVFAHMLAEDTADRLVIVGGDGMRGELEIRSQRADLAGRVTFTDQLGAPEVALHMAAADVLLMPSRAEGLGLSAVEALACGTPVVATRIGGIPEVVPESGCGELVVAEDPAEMAAAAARVLGKGKDTYSEACIMASQDQGIDTKAEEFLALLWRVVAR